MDRFKKVLSWFSSLSGLSLFVLACCNFSLAYKAVSVSRSVVLTNVVEMAVSPSGLSTNLSSTQSFSPPSSLSPVFSAPTSLAHTVSSPDTPVTKEVARWPYRYFVVRRRIGCEFMNRYYYDGSSCSYGRISAIYPDRILLDGGDWITNTLLSSDIRRDPKVAKND